MRSATLDKLRTESESGSWDRPGVGEKTDLRALYDAHFAFVWRNLRRLGVPADQMEDAAQEVFLVVHRRWDSFDSSWSSVQTWLFGIVLRVAQNERRSQRRRVARLVPANDHHPIDAVASESASPSELVVKHEAARMLEEALEALSENERAIFVLVDIEQMPVPEAAEALALNLNTAYGRLRTARAEFQKIVRRLRARHARSEGLETP
jgi:RNA polymerase sigma-70 factor (ECF subfamily)